MESKIFAGIDEVGRGCLAGPVISCVVVLKKNIKRKFLKDSKTIPLKDRIKIAKHIKKNSVLLDNLFNPTLMEDDIPLSKSLLITTFILLFLSIIFSIISF